MSLVVIFVGSNPIIRIEKFLAKTSCDDFEGEIDMCFGRYFYTQQVEEFIDEYRASVIWNIVIKDDKNAVMTMLS